MTDLQVQIFPEGPGNAGVEMGAPGHGRVLGIDVLRREVDLGAVGGVGFGCLPGLLGNHQAGDVLRGIATGKHRFGGTDLDLLAVAVGHAAVGEPVPDRGQTGTMHFA